MAATPRTGVVGAWLDAAEVHHTDPWLDELRDAGAIGIYDTPADLAAALDDLDLT